MVDNALEHLGHHTLPYIKVQQIILDNMKIDELYSTSDFDQHGTPGHKNDLIETIIATYLKMKSKFIADNLSRANKEKPMRHDLIKKIHFAGQ